MSKKLLLNSFSSGSSEGLTPIQNGLVCWLDAFDLTAFDINTTWLDRTNNNNNGTVCYAPVVTSLGNGILHAKTSVNIPNPTKGLSQYTVEIGYEDISAIYWMGLWGNLSNNTLMDGLSLYQINNSIGCYPYIFDVQNKDGIKMGKNYLSITVKSNNINIFLKGERFSSVTPTKEIQPSQANYFCFMGRKPNTVDIDTKTVADTIMARWYFIRIYNRVLTDEEILNNYNYELSLQRGE